MTPHDRIEVITIKIARPEVRKILIHGGSSSDIIFHSAIKHMGIERRNLIYLHDP